MRADLAALDRLIRARQVQIQTATALSVARSFVRLPMDAAMDEKSPAVEDWVERASRLTLLAHDRLAAEGRTYYEAVQRLTSPGYVPRHADIEAPDEAQLRTSLAVTGIVGLRKRLERVPSPTTPPPGEEDRFAAQRTLLDAGRARLEAEAKAKAGAAAGAAMARHAGNGLRHQIQDTVKQDRRTLGYVRVTSGDPCYFCAMLAGRGPVYKEDSFEDSNLLFDGPGYHKVHDSCACSMRPVYTRSDDEKPDFNLRMEAGWSDLTDELGYSPSLQEWRNFYEELRRAA